MRPFVTGTCKLIQVGNVREWLFTPLARFASFIELNDWLATRCQELAQRRHPRFAPSIATALI